MKTLTVATLFLFAFALMPGRELSAHCQVPCGIYGDQARFEAMLENTATIRKAMEQIAVLAGKSDALSANQLARWVAVKEEHATKTQNIIARYFMTQRIKPAETGGPGWGVYVAKLTAAHRVMRQAMKCKQTVDPKQADALKAAILAFHTAYAGK